ncbi:PREDICTED: cdc42 effector protein 2 [Chaetura pelagica]|uniref:cdc42 effector protein 2 n=1 Tax=Chaetura pelagica TaxID=8897 RepID=UPI0005231290|nr:PREDICTED: cdc42 effector protein 2 [Chaetura pelagica]
MSTKAPIYLKRGSRKGKKEKLRDILSSDMISPPLGDFRHTIHIGSGGESDMFGDISFLQGKFHLLPRTSLDSRDSPEAPAPPFQFSRTATISGHQPPSLETSSPLLKNAISLPILGGPQALTLPPAQAPPPKPPRLHLDDRAPPSQEEEEEEDPCTSRLATNGFTEEKSSPEPFLSHAGSLLSLHVDLGPSILEDVLQVMEKHHEERVGGSIQEILTAPPSQEEEEEEDPCTSRLATNGFTEEKSSPEPFLSHAGSLLSLHVDLGPSILEDVLQVMEKHHEERVGGSIQEILTAHRANGT